MVIELVRLLQFSEEKKKAKWNWKTRYLDFILIKMFNVGTLISTGSPDS